DRLQGTILSKRCERKGCALLLMDLDNFKEINDTLGHHNGDILLQEIGLRLLNLFQNTDTVARMGGDEFAVLLDEVDMENAVSAAGRILQAIEPPFVIEGLTLQVDASIGIAFCPEHGEDTDLLIQRAEVAMYMAKKFVDGYRIFDPEHDPYNTRRLVIISDLRRAIDNNQLSLYYQPKIDLKTGDVTGVEALARWQHPAYGFIPPDQFIPLAEQSGLIKPLTLWVLNEALRECRARSDEGIKIGVAVNISARNLQDVQLPAQIAELLDSWKVSPDLLELEITESTIMLNPEVSMDTLKHLNAMGIRLSVDDFGTGHSSLAYLKRLPINEIKIDKSFIKDICKDSNDTLIVQATIDLGHNLGLTVVAEGVENQDVYDRLAGLGCDIVQGYFISPPIPAAEFKKWFKARVTVY
ncbi:MAG: EAL domain-containing protein, partial [Nitrospirae bacterium]|nr:EAL domain-containing protein [Nitrospirota bacterium]